MTAVSALLFSFSLLTLFKAPIRLLWIPAVLATEWFYLCFGITLIWLILCWIYSGPTATGLTLAAALLFLSPGIRAQLLANQISPNALCWSKIFRGLDYGDIQVQGMQYESAGVRLGVDLYRKQQAPAGLPLVMVIHGGSWRSGDRSELADFNRLLASKGHAVASIDYRLAPETTFPGPREDVNAALKHLRSKEKELGLDMRRVVLLGRSAGGQIALSAAYQKPDPGVRGVIAFYSPNDLIFAYENPGNPLMIKSRELLRAYLGGTLDEKHDLYKEASPLFHVIPSSLPTLLIHGSRDELVWPGHSERLMAKLAELKVKHQLLRLPWGTHGCDANPRGPGAQISTFVVEQFLRSLFDERKPA